MRWSESKLWSGTLGSIVEHASVARPRLGRTRYAKGALLLGSVELLPFRDEPGIPRSRSLLEVATATGAKSLFVGRSFITDVMD
jgi:hypothetical protein